MHSPLKSTLTGVLVMAFVVAAAAQSKPNPPGPPPPATSGAVQRIDIAERLAAASCES